MTGNEGEAFLDRWSRLKRARELEPEPPHEADPAPEPAARETRTDAEVLEELGLPDPDTLEAGDDFSGFMAKAVPEALRRRALRRLWVSNPVLANLDELLDYGDDFTDAATVVENLQTGYQVGRGFLRDEPDPEEAPGAAAQPDGEVEEAEAGAPDQMLEAQVDPADQSVAQAEGPDTERPDTERPDTEGPDTAAFDTVAQPARPGRMRFRVPQQG